MSSMNWNDTDIGFQPITNHSIFVELTLYRLVIQLTFQKKRPFHNCLRNSSAGHISMPSSVMRGDLSCEMQI